MKNTSILLIGESRFSQYLQTSLNHQNLFSETTDCLKKAADLVKNNDYKVILCAIPYGNYSSEELLEFLKENSPKSNVIFLAEDIRVCKAIELVKKGLYTCLQKPFLVEDIVYHTKKALASIAPENIVSPISNSIDQKIGAKYVKGESPQAIEMLNQIQLVGPTNFSVIIYGETGTGKESVAERLVAEHGKNCSIVAVDCGCLSRELAASELFGHEKGAFTGANSVKIGAFERAHNGTLFLDEVGNLDYEVQTYLLRAIQERKIRKVGSEKEIPVNVRIIVASNENLAEKVRKGEFREDLYHRLNEFEITIPALRERKEDLKLFIDHFIKEANAELGKNIAGMDDEAFELLNNYHFPGNIRELKNIIRRACLLTSDKKLISKKSFPKEIIKPVATIINSEDLQHFHFKKPKEIIKDLTEKVEMENILSVLQQVQFNKTQAAAMLNIDRKTLYNKLKRYNHVF